MLDVLGCSKEQYDQLVKKVDVKPIYQFIQKYGPGAIGVCQYADHRGRFMPVKYKQDHIAKTTFDALDSKGKMQILQYLEDKDEGAF